MVETTPLFLCNNVAGIKCVVVYTDKKKSFTGGTSHRRQFDISNLT